MEFLFRSPYGTKLVTPSFLPTILPKILSQGRWLEVVSSKIIPFSPSQEIKDYYCPHAILHTWPPKTYFAPLNLFRPTSTLSDRRGLPLPNISSNKRGNDFNYCPPLKFLMSSGQCHRCL